MNVRLAVRPAACREVPSRVLASDIVYRWMSSMNVSDDYIG